MLDAALARGRAFLLAAQEPDGTWRDHALPPGASEGWSTAWVGLALAAAPASPPVDAALERAAGALRALRTPNGWAYNRATAADADSTAWALRLLAARGTPDPCAAGLLARFVDQDGRAHTFVGERFGTWAGAHPDVTPAVGLALLAAGGESADAIAAVRAACLADVGEDGGWPAFWWADAAYTAALALEFLAASGGVPSGVRLGAARWLARAPASACTLGHAWRLTIALAVDDTVSAAVFADALTSSQEPDGGWPASAVLLVPSQTDGAPGAGNPDVRRLMSTAAAVRALTLWRSAARA